MFERFKNRGPSGQRVEQVETRPSTQEQIKTERAKLQENMTGLKGDVEKKGGWARIGQAILAGFQTTATIASVKLTGGALGAFAMGTMGLIPAGFLAAAGAYAAGHFSARLYQNLKSYTEKYHSDIFAKKAAA